MARENFDRASRRRSWQVHRNDDADGSVEIASKAHRNCVFAMSLRRRVRGLRRRQRRLRVHLQLGSFVQSVALLQRHSHRRRSKTVSP